MEKNPLVKKALYLAKKCHYKQALKLFEQERCSALQPVPMSYLALCLVFVEEDYERAITLCVKAVKRECYNPELYFNLGRVLAKSGRKGHAFKAFKKGLALDRSHLGLLREIKSMGIRRTLPMPFLSRKNPVNRFLGLTVGKLIRRGRSREQQDMAKLFRTRYY